MNKENSFSESNRLKAIAGADLAKYIGKELDFLLESGVIKDYKRNENFKHENYEYGKQFLANFLIETFNGKYIIVRSSNSFRSDRAKIGFYDIDGILNYSNFSKDIIASIYLVPDTELENTEFNLIRQKIQNQEYYCPASHLLTLSEFISFLEEHEYEVRSEFEEVTTELFVGTTVQERGSLYGKSGNQFERELVEILSDPQNLAKLKKNQLKPNHIFNIILSKIFSDKKIKAKEITKIEATNSIPLLKNGGNPKTDIKIDFKTATIDDFSETMSLKNTGQSKVTCHDYTASGFIRVLKCEETKLAKYLTLFQQYPTYKDFEKNMSAGDSVLEFENLLIEKRAIFNQWALMGKHDLQNLVVPESQISNYLLLRSKDKKKLAFYSTLDYIDIILKRSKLKFGVPFSWTYPSKQRGKRIQLKVPVYFE